MERPVVGVQPHLGLSDDLREGCFQPRLRVLLGLYAHYATSFPCRRLATAPGFSIRSTVAFRGGPNRRSCMSATIAHRNTSPPQSSRNSTAYLSRCAQVVIGVPPSLRCVGSRSVR